MSIEGVPGSGLEIYDDRMTSEVIPNVATKLSTGRWVISDFQVGRVFDRNQAITAMMLLIMYAQGKTAGDDPIVQAWEEELGVGNDEKPSAT
ncbi:hypothetical protein [Nonomuraea candida]|uniref:hypothetical protein n=1 Tax=Nonomuraea candida TaxID=359159 RepID=UPI0005B9FCBA|nr:hypothetical protein [Nonomuraea candida]